MKKTVYILRGVSGSGKSTLAQELVKNRLGVICCADDYFMVDGEYKFDSQKLKYAHEHSRNTFDDALSDNTVDVIVVANTNTTEKDFSYYEDKCREKDISPFFLVIENRHGNKDVHGVPNESLLIQENRIKNSLKLK